MLFVTCCFWSWFQNAYASLIVIINIHNLLCIFVFEDYSEGNDYQEQIECCMEMEGSETEHNQKQDAVEKNISTSRKQKYFYIH